MGMGGGDEVPRFWWLPRLKTVVCETVVLVVLDNIFNWWLGPGGLDRLFNEPDVEIKPRTTLFWLFVVIEMEFVGLE